MDPKICSADADVLPTIMGTRRGYDDVGVDGPYRVRRRWWMYGRCISILCSASSVEAGIVVKRVLADEDEDEDGRFSK